MKQFGIMVGLDKPESFEGWFCKIDDRVNDLMVSVILGYATHRGTEHAFIQFTSSLDHQTAYISYPIEELAWERDPFVLKIGNNRFSEQGIQLDFEMAGREVKGDLAFGPFETIREFFMRPNIMGWLTHFPNECNHSIISMHHRVKGQLMIGASSWEIEAAGGYIEKDWGTGFPREYVWVHANNWEASSCVFSYATVPMLGRYAKGFFLMLHHQGKEYRFSSIEGSHLIDFQVNGNSFTAIIQKGRYRVALEAKQDHPVKLASPVKGQMNAYIKESLDGMIHISMTDQGETVIDLSSQRASIDVHF